MVKVGFLVEGDTEKKLIFSDNFRNFCQQIKIEILPTVFPPKGKRGKDIFKDAEKVNAFVNILKDQGAEYIFVIRDLEDLDCIIEARNQIASQNVVKIIVVRTIESWFLADTTTLVNYFEDANISYQFPEVVENPFEELRRINLEKRQRGLKDKLIFAGNMLKFGFSIQNAASHPNCPSANYFLTKLEQLSPQ